MSRQQILWLLKAVGVIFRQCRWMAWVIGAWLGDILLFCGNDVGMSGVYLECFAPQQQYANISSSINRAFIQPGYAPKGAKGQHDLRGILGCGCRFSVRRQTTQLNSRFLTPW